MIIQRTNDRVNVLEPGRNEDDTNIHEFTIIEDFCDDAFDVIAASEGHQQKALIEYLRSGTKDVHGIDWWKRDTSPESVRAHLETQGYLLR